MKMSGSRCPYCYGKLEKNVVTWVKWECDVCNLRWEKNGDVRYWVDKTWIPGWAEVPKGCLIVRDL